MEGLKENDKVIVIGTAYEGMVGVVSKQTGDYYEVEFNERIILLPKENLKRWG